MEDTVIKEEIKNPWEKMPIMLTDALSLYMIIMHSQVCDISHTLVSSTDHQWTPRSERSPVGRKRSKEESSEQR